MREDTTMNVHFMGIGGISMSALAEICINKGYSVTGSDMQDSYLIDHLRSLGAKIAIGQKKENITDDINMVVYTAAISNDNEEFKAARSEEHTSELQSRQYLVCRLLLEKKKK